MSRQSKNVINWRKNTKRKIIMAMGGCCQICGYMKCDEALELHHLDPTKKELSFGSIRANPKNILKIRDELLKCVLVCSNCHKEVHAGITSIPETYAKLDENILLAKRRKCKECKEMYLDIYSQQFCSPQCAGRVNGRIGVQRKFCSPVV